eukprot:SAG31_NODE_1238_length_9176_cov_9.589181_4_plen_190_part_00
MVAAERELVLPPAWGEGHDCERGTVIARVTPRVLPSLPTRSIENGHGQDVDEESNASSSSYFSSDDENGVDRSAVQEVWVGCTRQVVPVAALKKGGRLARPSSLHSLHTLAARNALAELASIICPGLEGARLIGQHVAIRPISKDGAPVVGQPTGLCSCTIATGHGDWGVLLGPSTGNAVAEMILHGGD